MKTLEEIKSFAEQHKACDAQYDKFVEFIDNGDELSAWQTVLGNIDWLKGSGLDIDITDVIEKANGVGKTWWKNGQISGECTYKDGKRNGLYRRWYPNGQLEEECAYKDGKRNG